VLLVFFVIGAGSSTLLFLRAQAARMEAVRSSAEAEAQRDRSEAALQEVIRAEQDAREHAEAVRQEEEMQRKKLEELLEKARKAEKEAKDQARRALYQAQILLAQQALERQLAEPGKGP
jgi:hypothetical protein